MQTVLAFILVLSASFCKTDDTDIKLDGVINNAEWAGAREYDLSSGGRLYVIIKEKVAYLGIKGNDPGWAHVYLHRNDSVKVLHASAALGAQLYTYKNETWKLQKKFNWEVRESVYDEILKQKQDAYYKKNGWCANNNNTGDKTTLEFKINIDYTGTAEPRFAVLYTADAKSLSFYPAGLTDNTLLKELVSGSNPDDLQFRPETWEKLK